MKKTITVLVTIVLVGCARFSTVQTDVSPNRTITTRAAGYTLFNGNSKLASWKASQTDKSQGASVSDMQQSSSGTNTVELLKAIRDIMMMAK